MAIPVLEDFITLDKSMFGTPHVVSTIKVEIAVLTLDYSKYGTPFVSNVPQSGGGNEYSDSVSDSGTLSDAASVHKTHLKSVAESGTLTDAISAGLILFPIIDEEMTLTDSAARVRDTFPSVAEELTGSDWPSPSPWSKIVTEEGTLVDELHPGNSEYTRGVTSQGTLADSVLIDISGLAYPEVSEEGTLEDSLIVGKGWFPQVYESAELAENISDLLLGTLRTFSLPAGYTVGAAHGFIRSWDGVLYVIAHHNESRDDLKIYHSLDGGANWSLYANIPVTFDNGFQHISGVVAMTVTSNNKFTIAVPIHADESGFYYQIIQQDVTRVVNGQYVYDAWYQPATNYRFYISYWNTGAGHGAYGTNLLYDHNGTLYLSTLMEQANGDSVAYVCVKRATSYPTDGQCQTIQVTSGSYDCKMAQISLWDHDRLHITFLVKGLTMNPSEYQVGARWLTTWPYYVPLVLSDTKVVTDIVGGVQDACTVLWRGATPLENELILAYVSNPYGQTGKKHSINIRRATVIAETEYDEGSNTQDYRGFNWGSAADAVCLWEAPNEDHPWVSDVLAFADRHVYTSNDHPGFPNLKHGDIFVCWNFRNYDADASGPSAIRYRQHDPNLAFTSWHPTTFEIHDFSDDLIVIDRIAGMNIPNDPEYIQAPTAGRGFDFFCYSTTDVPGYMRSFGFSARSMELFSGAVLSLGTGGFVHASQYQGEWIPGIPDDDMAVSPGIEVWGFNVYWYQFQSVWAMYNSNLGGYFWTDSTVSMKWEYLGLRNSAAGDPFSLDLKFECDLGVLEANYQMVANDYEAWHERDNVVYSDEINGIQFDGGVDAFCKHRIIMRWRLPADMVPLSPGKYPYGFRVKFTQSR